MNTTSFLRCAGSLAVAAMLSACSGMGSTTPSAANAPLALPQSMPDGFALDANCPKKNGINVKPCSVKLSVSNPYANVTVKYPSGDDIKDSDKKCANKNIATVAGSDGTYVVTAGTSAGSCQVTFTVTSGKKLVGTGTLKITNDV